MQEKTRVSRRSHPPSMAGLIACFAPESALEELGFSPSEIDELQRQFGHPALVARCREASDRQVAADWRLDDDADLDVDEDGPPLYGADIDPSFFALGTLTVDESLVLGLGDARGLYDIDAPHVATLTSHEIDQLCLTVD